MEPKAVEWTALEAMVRNTHHDDDGKLRVVVCRRGVPVTPDRRPVKDAVWTELWRWSDGTAIHGWVLPIGSLDELVLFIHSQARPPIVGKAVRWRLSENQGATLEFLLTPHKRWVVVQVGAPRAAPLLPWEYTDQFCTTLGRLRYRLYTAMTPRYRVWYK